MKYFTFFSTTILAHIGPIWGLFWPIPDQIELYRPELGTKKKKKGLATDTHAAASMAA